MDDMGRTVFDRIKENLTMMKQNMDYYKSMREFKSSNSYQFKKELKGNIKDTVKSVKKDISNLPCSEKLEENVTYFKTVPYRAENGETRDFVIFYNTKGFVKMYPLKLPDSFLGKLVEALEKTGKGKIAGKEVITLGRVKSPRKMPRTTSDFAYMYNAGYGVDYKLLLQQARYAKIFSKVDGIN